MEQYQGVKFGYQRKNQSFSFDEKLTTLNNWAFLLSELGLTPVHPEGAYGNQSYRTGTSSFIITKSGMQPEQELKLSNYSHVVEFVKSDSTFLIEGEAVPSSECFLHNALYEHLPNINAILHGHSALLNKHSDTLSIPVTKKFHDYGTKELADSAIEIIDEATNIFILKNHGFVVIDASIEGAGKTTLDYYVKLIKTLKND